MLPSTDSGFKKHHRLETEEDLHRKRVMAGEPAPTVLACIFVLPQDATPVLEVLRILSSSGAFQNPVNIGLADAPQCSHESDDSWLEHAAAARHLGISSSTLYRYAERGLIESRKLGNRLRYRRSILDDFKDQSVRPARRSADARCIIPSAPVSGK